MPSPPRLLPHAIARARLCAWLERHAEYPLRLILAPTGFGKSTGLAGYAATRAGKTYFLALRKPTGEKEFRDALAEAVAARGVEYRDVVAALEADAPCDVLVDGVEWLDEAATALLERLVCEIPRGIGVVAAGTRTKLDVARYVLRGFAVAAAPDALLFSGPEMAALAERVRFEATEEQLDDLLLRTDGWPIVVGDVMRALDGAATRPADAYEHWLAARGESFAALMRDELARARPETRDAVAALVQGSAVVRAAPEDLFGDGAPVVPHEGGARALRTLIDVTTRIDPPPDDPRAEPVRVRVFGRFAVRTGEREVPWVRRRDQQIFRYLLLQPETRATKSQLIGVFWPEADPTLALQSLRTACSNIRKALARGIGPAATERMFLAGGAELRLDMSGAAVDLFRFKAHLAAAQAAEDEGDAHGTLAHAVAAERLHRADLFAGEPPEAWYESQRAIYREMRDYAAGRAVRLRVELRVARGEDELTQAPSGRR